ncbi:MAG TPA: hypothetical protein VNZ86_04055 [Bacteroidia bacterium]|jgi:putative oxidoreductase|nr:hypothetical protein [Bacteroidia bacterium]
MATFTQTLHKIDRWSKTNKTYTPVPLRIIFGIFLIWKAFQFGEKPETLPMVMGRLDFLEIFLIVYLVIVQLASGILIMCGLITRTAILCLLPILTGSVVYSPRASIHLPFTGELWAALSLVLALVFLVLGSGMFSCDRYLQNHPPVSHVGPIPLSDCYGSLKLTPSVKKEMP